MATSPTRYDLTDSERRSLRELYQSARDRHALSTTETLLNCMHSINPLLPVGVVSFIQESKSSESAPAFIVAGIPLDLSERTPVSILPDQNARVVTENEFYHFAISSLVGQIFAFNSIQFGNMINNVMPIENNSSLPISSGYLHDFGFHTEDAFHPCSGDYLGLMCIHNPDSVPTTIAYYDDCRISSDIIEILFQSRFLIKANIAHNVAQSNVKKTSILFGSKARPYIRINLNLLDPSDHDLDESRALMALSKALNDVKTNVPLTPGDLIYIDNLRAVHGRDTYTPRFDGLDRWLQRLYITTGWRFNTEYRSESQKYTLVG